jgi:hypothetical protein
MLSSEQLRAARALLRWEQTRLAEQATVSVETVKEAGEAGWPAAGLVDTALS